MQKGVYFAGKCQGTNPGIFAHLVFVLLSRPYLYFVTAYNFTYDIMIVLSKVS